MRVPFADVGIHDPALKNEILDGLAGIVGTGGFILGPEVEALEKNLAAFCASRHCVAVNSGTSALHLALLASGIGPGDEVVTVPNTFIATLEAITYTGATIRLADVDEKTGAIDPGRLERAVGAKTKAVVPVHLYGQTAYLDPVLELARKRNLAVIEDACQAHGARYRGKPAGSFGAAGCFSFYPSKNLGACGEGGALVTDDGELAGAARVLRDHGQREKGIHERLGYNYRMEGFQGLVLKCKLPHLDSWNQQRREAARRYDELLKDSPVTVPTAPADRIHVYHLYVIRAPRRDALRTHLADRGIGTGIHYPVPCHLQPGFRFLGYGPGDFPVAERRAGEILSLPMFPGITAEQIEYVCASLGEFYGKN